MEDHFKNINTSIYRLHRERYLPTKIKYLFVAESPPAFKTAVPSAYFYFDTVPKADSLFYTIIKAIFDIDFDKYVNNRVETLYQFQDDGFYLIDAVDYPINKDKNWDDTPNSFRDEVIFNNRSVFEQNLNVLSANGNLNKQTKSILIKETVFNQYGNHPLLNVANKKKIGFPSYIKDRRTIEAIRSVL